MDIHALYKLKIWDKLTPAERDYDRVVAKSIPRGASFTCETLEGRKLQHELLDRERYEGCCSCHISAPCSYCINRSEDGFNDEEATV